MAAKEKQLNEADLARLKHAQRQMMEILREQVASCYYGPLTIRCKELEIVVDSMLSWHTHPDDLQSLLAEWGEWMRERIQVGDSMAFKRLAKIVSAFHNQAKTPHTLTAKEIPIKRARARPKSPHAKEILFARAAIGAVIMAIIDRVKLDGTDIRQRMNELRQEKGVAWSDADASISDEEFSRCVSHFGIKGLLTASKERKRGSKQSVSVRSNL